MTNHKTQRWFAVSLSAQLNTRCVYWTSWPLTPVNKNVHAEHGECCNENLVDKAPFICDQHNFRWLFWAFTLLLFFQADHWKEQPIIMQTENNKPVSASSPSTLRYIMGRYFHVKIAVWSQILNLFDVMICNIWKECSFGKSVCRLRIKPTSHQVLAHKTFNYATQNWADCPAESSFEVRCKTKKSDETKLFCRARDATQTNAQLLTMQRLLVLKEHGHCKRNQKFIC